MTEEIEAELRATVADLNDRLIAMTLCVRALLRASPDVAKLLEASMPDTVDADPNALALAAQVRKLLPPAASTD